MPLIDALFLAAAKAGRLNLEIATPSRSSVRASPKYGNFTDEASCSRYASRASCGIARISSEVFGALLKMNRLPSNGAMVVPRELNAWARFKRLAAVFGGPRTATYGFAETCKTVIPAASTISAARNKGKGKDGTLAAGIKSAAP